MSRVDYEYEFDPDAVNNTAAAIYKHARRGGPRILDLGSGPGIVASHLSTVDGKSTTCVDSDPDLLAVAADRGIGRTLVANLDDESWSDAVAGEQFDVVILADVLEHLYDPGQVLDTLQASSLLAPGGYLVVSIPNASHEGALAELVSGNFTYRPTGLLDETHIRFFTLNSFTALAESHGFLITHIDRTIRTLEQTSFKDRLDAIPDGFRKMVVDHNPEVRTYQYVMKLVPAREPDLLAARAEKVVELEETVVELEKTVAELRKMVSESEVALKSAESTPDLTDELQAIRARLAAETDRRQSLTKDLQRLRSTQVRRLVEVDSKRRELIRQIDQLKSERADLQHKVQELDRRVETILSSNTWKVGSRIHSLASPLIGRRKKSDAGGLPPVSAPSVTEAAQLSPSRHALAGDYQAEVSRVVDAVGTGVGFMVSTTDFDEGRGDVFVAVGLGRFLRRIGFSPTYVPEAFWYDVPEGLDWIVSMLPTYLPSRAPAGTRVIAWVRNEVDNWLAHSELPLFDAVLSSSELAISAISERYAGPTAVFPIGVDLELFEPPASETDRTIAITTVNQWGRERDVYRALRSTPHPFSLGIYGKSVGLHPDLDADHRGLVDFFALPDLYQRAGVVIDDFNHTTIGWGAVNSRVFEGLAAGALPVTNSALGLESLGLSGLPVYKAPDELNPLVRSLLEDSEARAGLTQSLRSVVVERHSYEQRAREFASFTKDIGEVGLARRAIAFFPDYRQNNPYQDMLYSALKDHRTAAFPIDQLSSLEESLPAREGTRRVLHVHWTAPILGPAETEGEALTILESALDSIDRFKEGGGNLVWTIHNELPHEVRYQALEIHLRNELARRADMIHVMCQETIHLLRDRYPLPIERTVVIPHSGYVGVYPDAADRELARHRLGVDPDDIVLLALGGIRPYKRLDALVAAFDRALTRESKLRLVVAGKPGRFPGVRDLQELCDSHPRIIALFNEIAAEDLQHFYKACDVAVLAHRDALNSGALLLAYSFGRPVIAPRVGCLDEALIEEVSISYPPGDDAALENALAEAGALVSDEVRRAARIFADSRPVSDMSAVFLKALDQFGL